MLAILYKDGQGTIVRLNLGQLPKWVNPVCSSSVGRIEGMGPKAM